MREVRALSLSCADPFLNQLGLGTWSELLAQAKRKGTRPSVGGARAFGFLVFGHGVRRDRSFQVLCFWMCGPTRQAFRDRLGYDTETTGKGVSAYTVGIKLTTIGSFASDQAYNISQRVLI